jgi:23S rRNA pseudouridine1911/1915/1917 synthase
MHLFDERWPVFFEDNHLLAVYKPAGLLTQADRSGAPCLLELAKAWVKQRHQKPGRVFLGLVQRLDRPVAGVMLFARTSKAAARLSDQIRGRRLRKVYLAVVEGRPAEPSARLVHHIERAQTSSRIVAAPTAVSREARLAYRVVGSAGARSLLEIELETGRKHQIRLQLSRIGCPVAGDLRYGSPAPLPGGAIALFAREVACEHPTRREMLTFRAPLPAGWPWPQAGPADPAPPWNWEEYEIPGGPFKA